MENTKQNARQVIQKYFQNKLSSGQRKFVKKMLAAVVSRLVEFYPGTLSALGKIYKTDKGNEDHSYKGLSYLDIYEKYFKAFKRKPINLLEIGVLKGNSLRMFKRYFPKADIFGIDIDPQAKQYEESRIFIEIGNQADEKFLEEVSGKAKEFDIIIDDGSHVNKHILKSFNCLFKKLKKGGIYIIEDLGRSYDNLEELSIGDGRKGVRELWPGMKYNNPEEKLNNDREELNLFFNKIIYDLDHRQGKVLSIHFWPMLCIILKA